MYNDYPPLRITPTGNRRPLKIALVVTGLLVVAAVAGYFVSMALSKQLQANAVKDELITQNQRLKASKVNDVLSDDAIARISSTDRAKVHLAVAQDHKSYCIEASSINTKDTISFHMDGTTPELEPLAGLCGEGAQNTPAKVTGLAVASKSAGAVSLAWKTIPDAYEYLLECSVSDSYATIAASAKASDVKGVVENLKATDAYYCRVAATNSKGQGEWSDSIKTETAELLTWPQGLETKALSTTSISYSWKPVDGAKQYVFEYSKDSGFTKEVTRIPTAQTSGTLTGLSKFTVYYFHVKAITEAVSEVQAPFSPIVQGRTNE